MKKYIIPVICLSAIFATSCVGLLDEPQKGTVAYEDFYKTDEDAEGALVAMYARFAKNITRPNNEFITAPYISLLNLPGDDIYAAGEFYGDNDFNGQINEFRYDENAQLVTSMYKGFYQIIYGANLVICNTDSDSPIKKRCIAEARVLRAWTHMMLALGWGTPPLVDRLLEGSEKPVNSTSQKDLLEWCAKECEDAVADLVERSSTSDKDNTVRITKGMAWTTAGKAWLYAGNMSKAKENLGKVIASGKYALVPGERIRETFHLEGDGNEEQIFASNIVVTPAISSSTIRNDKSTWMMAHIWSWRGDHFANFPTDVYNGWGGLGIRQDFADELVENDGFDSYRRKAWIKKIDPEVLYEMPYKDGITGKENLKSSPDRGIKTYLYGQSEYLSFKRHAMNNEMYEAAWLPTNFLIFRYAEVLLMYAEACIGNDADGSGLKALNDIQRRAGSKTISPSLTLDAVKKEKKLEMHLEGVRFFDMVRWGDVEGVLHNGETIPQVYDAYWVSDPDNMDAKGESEHRIYVVDQHPNAGKKVGFQKGKHELFPFPFAETSINPEIHQNPGWGESNE